MCIGEIFLEFVNMLPAFQTYCLQQSVSVNMLNTLEKEKELLRYTHTPGNAKPLTSDLRLFVLSWVVWTETDS